MGWVALSEPGTEYGPCADTNCGHEDCGWTRAMAEGKCRICGQPIGYGRPAYRDPDQEPNTGPVAYVHVGCLIDSTNGAPRHTPKEPGEGCKYLDDHGMNCSWDEGAEAPGPEVVRCLSCPVVELNEDGEDR